MAQDSSGPLPKRVAPLCLPWLFRAGRLGATVVVGLLWAGSACAVTPDSPEVQQVVDKAIAYLDEYGDSRLGGKCLAGLAILKATGNREHPRIAEAIDACRNGVTGSLPYSDTYSNGLAIIFLCELDADRHRELIDRYLRSMRARQKPHGGWGYEENDTGDTSQTQYGVLSYWEAHAKGVAIDRDSAVRVLGWLMRTQDVEGGWGYQGRDPGTGGRVQQTNVSVSLAAAGLGSVMICGHLLGVPTEVLAGDTGRAEAADDEEGLDEPDKFPPAVQPIEAGSPRAVRPIGTARIDRQRYDATIEKGQGWMNRNYDITIDKWNNYYLYALERYKSFEEVLSGEAEEEPYWYNDGFRLLRDTQREDGSWQNGGGQAVDTAFGILFLIRSMRMTLEESIGDGALVGGRGLPQNVASARIENGQLVAEETRRSVEELLAILEDPTHPEHDLVLSSPASLISQISSEINDDEATRLKQLLKSAQPSGRWLAARTLASRRDLDDVPALIYALSDPNPTVVLAARDGLRFISRRFEGFGPPEQFDDRQRYDAVEKWKAWFRSIRPGAELER